MAEVTYYGALPFVLSDDGVAAGEPTDCFNPNAAVMRAEALSRKEGHVGAVAFGRTGDPATGNSATLRSSRSLALCPICAGTRLAPLVDITRARGARLMAGCAMSYCQSAVSPNAWRGVMPKLLLKLRPKCERSLKPQSKAASVTERQRFSVSRE